MMQDFGNGWGFFIDIENRDVKKQKVYICMSKPKPEIKKCKNSFYKLDKGIRAESYTTVVEIAPNTIVLLPKPNGKKKGSIVSFLCGSLFISGVLYAVMCW